MNHRRGRPKSSRAGCLLCKPHKHQGARKVPRSPAARAALSDDLRELEAEAGLIEDDRRYVDFLWAEHVEAFHAGQP